MKTATATITYHYRGQIERGHDYHWADGYSETTDSGAVCYPCMTMRECQSEAKAKGAKAVFADDDREIDIS